ncbi:MAG: 2-amino-4-hydroxy-6-hydroxymethyldihydropteridine diphosphokinase [Caldisericia bacterium]|nr:2-amino-4-hydroxy-6-hydroxymethyldihydropteridine diphosphokinase [Caldisericia bacterium]
MEIHLSLGSNIEPREEFLKNAIFFLRDKIKIKKISSLYETEPWGYKNQEKFLNIVLSGETELEPENLIKFIKDVEKKVGRGESFKWGPREIDIDVILYGDRIIEKENLIVPHKFFEERGFVIIPLFEINKYLVNPKSKRNISEIYENVQKEGVVKLESKQFLKDIYSTINLKLIESDFEIIYFDEIHSTQDFLKENFSLNKVVVSKIQTKGRGRKGALWVSNIGGLYFSISIKPLDYIYFLPILISYSIAKVLSKFGILGIKIKIPNDIYLNNKKVCGVISEGYFKDSNLLGEIIGIGLDVNLLESDFPIELKDKATSLFIETNKMFFNDEILNLILKEIKINLENFEKKNVNYILKDLEENYSIFDSPFTINHLGKELKVYGKKFIDYKNLIVETSDKEILEIPIYSIP